MAVTQRWLISLTMLFSCASTALLLVSLFTTSWISGNVIVQNVTGAAESSINYGLYSGFISRTIGTQANAINLDLYLTCLIDNNVCAWSCIPDEDARKAELEELYNSGTLLNEYPNACVSTNNGTIPDRETPDQRFINAGIWISTLAFLALSILFAICTAALGVLNSVSNPISDALSVRGLYVYHGIAAVSCLLVLILWGAQYGSTLVDNVVYTEVISGNFRNTSVSLGYSYWVVIGAFVSHIGSIVILFTRQYLIDHETPPETPIKPNNEDGRIFLY